MFSESMDYGVRVCEESVDEFFKYITASSHLSDSVIKALSRVLLYNRASEDCKFEIRTHGFVSVDAADNPFYDSEEDSHGVIAICGVPSDKMEACKTAAEADGYLFNKASMAFKSSKVFIMNNFEKHKTIVYTEARSRANIRNVFMAFPQFIPWIVKENKFNEFEVSLLRTLNDKEGAHQFKELCNTFYIGKEFGKKVEEIAIRNLMTDTMKTRIDSVKLDIHAIREEIIQYEEAIRQKLARMEEKNIMLFGLENGGKDEKIDAFCRKFMANPNLRVANALNGTLTFIVETYLDNFSEDKYFAVRNNDCSCFYPDYDPPRDAEYGVDMPHALVRKIFDSIFIEGEYRLRVQAGFKIDFNHNSIYLTSCEGSAFSDIAIPNPHTEYYQCMGGFERLHNEALMDGDFEEVLDIAMSETANLNFVDTSPMAKFVNDFFGQYADTNCLRSKETGELITPKDLIKIKMEEMEEDA